MRLSRSASPASLIATGLLHVSSWRSVAIPERFTETFLLVLCFLSSSCLYFYVFYRGLAVKMRKPNQSTKNQKKPARRLCPQYPFQTLWVHLQSHIVRRNPKGNSIGFMRRCSCQPCWEAGELQLAPFYSLPLSAASRLGVGIFLAVLWWDAAASTAGSLPAVLSSLSSGDMGKPAHHSVSSTGTRTSLGLRFGMGTHGCTWDTLSSSRTGTSGMILKHLRN